MQWFRPADLQLSLRVPKRPDVVMGKFHFPRRLGMSELEGSVGSNLEIRGWLARNVFGHFALLQVKCSFPFKIIHIAGD